MKVLDKGFIKMSVAINKLVEKLKEERGSLFDNIIVIIIAVVLGMLLLGGLFFIIKDIVLEGLKTAINNIFNFKG